MVVPLWARALPAYATRRGVRGLPPLLGLQPAGGPSAGVALMRRTLRWLAGAVAFVLVLIGAHALEVGRLDVATWYTLAVIITVVLFVAAVLVT